MRKDKTPLSHKLQRPVLTDMLPFEVPPTFSNRSYYRFLRTYEIERTGNYVSWTADTSVLDATIGLLFGFDPATAGPADKDPSHRMSAKRRRAKLPKNARFTIPFCFKVSHKLEGRVLSVVHPRSQLEVACFYARFASLITYYSSISDFSIRHPVSVSRYSYFRDKTHSIVFDEDQSGIEEEHREYEELGSYFVYRKYRNIHRFFESVEYHQAEKHYSAMVQVDISKCFDSIYTHSLTWALIGKYQTKMNLESSESTFGGAFDKLLQSVNHSETNGIVVGPEFSRIFAELILQAVDVELRRKLLTNHRLRHKTDYRIFRYVDDYFIFYNRPPARLEIIEALQSILKQFKLSINPAKIKEYNKPIITDLTVAKERVSTLLTESIVPSIVEGLPDSDEPRQRVHCSINSNRLIVRFKAILKETQVEYSDILNYTLAIIENKTGKLLKLFRQCAPAGRDNGRLIQSILGILEFSFFIYSASPKVNHTVRLCRLLAMLIDFLKQNGFAYDHRHLIFKYVHINVMQQIENNVVTPYREVETLYLLVALSQIGREYRLPESTLVRYFGIEINGTAYTRPEFLNMFSITVLLTYIQNKERYNKLHLFLEAHIISKFEYHAAHCPNDAESIMLYLDLIVCPYISRPTKERISQTFGLSNASLDLIEGSNDQWFSSWGDRLNLRKELNAKRSREVY